MCPVLAAPTLGPLRARQPRARPVAPARPTARSAAARTPDARSPGLARPTPTRPTLAQQRATHTHGQHHPGPRASGQGPSRTQLRRESPGDRTLERHCARRREEEGRARPAGLHAGGHANSSPGPSAGLPPQPTRTLPRCSGSKYLARAGFAIKCAGLLPAAPQPAAQGAGASVAGASMVAQQTRSVGRAVHAHRATAAGASIAAEHAADRCGGHAPIAQASKLW